MPIYLSQSLVEDYLSCRRKPYFRINRPDSTVQNKEMVIGEIVHRALELYWDNRKLAEEFCSKECEHRLPGSRDSLVSALWYVDTYFDEFSSYMSKDDLTEYKFKVQLFPDVFVVGKMDRISNNSVFDWKTSRNPPSSITNNVQFIIYNWAFKKLFKKEPYGVYYAALFNGKLIKYRHDEANERILFNEVMPEIVTSIRKNQFIPDGIYKKSCFRCPYAKPCLEELGKDVLGSSTST